jgi:cell pole-organizing protein PopZ
VATGPSSSNTGKLGADAETAPHGAEVSNMSAPNPNPGERDFDAMRRAQRAHEPSMEEILASIRAIIADDREGDPTRAAPKPAAKPAPNVAYPTSEAALVREVEAAPAKMDVPASAPADAGPPNTVSIAPEPSLPQAVDRDIPSVVRMRPEIEPAVAPTPEAESETPSAPAEASDAPLLSEAADRAVMASFEALSSSVALHNAELVESLTREMLRPMIKTWLDENLPSLVERLVRAEIQRVARGGR